MENHEGRLEDVKSEWMDPWKMEGSASQLQMAEEEESRKNKNTNLNSSKWPHVISDAWTGAQHFRNFQSLSFFLSVPPRDLQKNPSCPIHNHAVTKSWSHALNRSLQLSPGHPLTASEDLGYCATLPVVFLSLLFGFSALSSSSLSLRLPLSVQEVKNTSSTIWIRSSPFLCVSCFVLLLLLLPSFSSLFLFPAAWLTTSLTTQQKLSANLTTKHK